MGAQKCDDEDKRISRARPGEGERDAWRLKRTDKGKGETDVDGDRNEPRPGRSLRVASSVEGGAMTRFRAIKARPDICQKKTEEVRRTDSGPNSLRRKSRVTMSSPTIIEYTATGIVMRSMARRPRLKLPV